MSVGEDAARPPLHVFLVATEESGDRLGGALMCVLRARMGAEVRFSGVGGHDMAAEGLVSSFSIHDLSIMGFLSIPQKLPLILRRIRETVAAVLAAKPDVLVIVDSPDFTHRVARRVRSAAPGIPIIDYVSPTVWAWRPGRAKAMRAYVDHVLALLPFEPAAHLRLGGPRCTYVGHPLAEQVVMLRPDAPEAVRRDADPPRLLLLPGSRGVEIKHLLATFMAAIDIVAQRTGPLDVVLPTVPHLRGRLVAATRDWPIRPRIVIDVEEKRAAFRTARAALAASGTVTLELAVAGIPTVVAYKVSRFEELVLRPFVRVPSIVLANLVLGDDVMPEYVEKVKQPLGHEAKHRPPPTPQNLADGVVALLGDTPQRRAQIEAFNRLDAIMEVGSLSPSERAADIVLEVARNGRQT